MSLLSSWASRPTPPDKRTAVQIISRRRHREDTSHTLFFCRRDERGAGFAFPCDEHGRVDVSVLPSASQASLAACRGKDAALYEEPEIETNTSSWVEPAVGLCDDCGAKVTLGGFTNTCDCGADYNGSGQRLAPREQWGCETGESVADILAIDGMSTNELLEGEGR